MRLINDFLSFNLPRLCLAIPQAGHKCQRKSLFLLVGFLLGRGEIHSEMFGFSSQSPRFYVAQILPLWSKFE